MKQQGAVLVAALFLAIPTILPVPLQDDQG